MKEIEAEKRSRMGELGEKLRNFLTSFCDKGLDFSQQAEKLNLKDIKKIGIIGDGRFAEAIAYLISKVHKDVEIVLWTHTLEHEKRAEKRGIFRHVKKKGLLWSRRIKLPENICITNDAETVVEGADVLFSILPAQKTRKVFETIFKDLIQENWGNIQAIISGTKGIERVKVEEKTGEGELVTIITETNQLISEVLQEVFESKKDKQGNIVTEGVDVSSKIGVISGLNFAGDIVNDDPMGTNLASSNGLVQIVGRYLLDQESFTVWPTEDIRGAEIVGAVKNVLAIATGVAKSLGYGDSTIHSLIGAGNEEIERFALAFGASEKTFKPSTATIRDLEGTATSSQSRNYQYGYALAKGKEKEETGIAEGADTAYAVSALAKKKNRTMPVCEAVLEMIERKKDISQIVQNLLAKLNARAKRVAVLSQEKAENEKKKAEMIKEKT